MDASPTSSRVGAVEAFGLPSLGSAVVEQAPKQPERSNNPRQKDSVKFSAEALAALAREASPEGEADTENRRTERPQDSGNFNQSLENSDSRSGAEDAPTEEETEQLRSLRARDREVRAHENAHSAAAGALAQGGPSYEFQKGPDGVAYAVGGEVQISLRSGSTPEESLRLAQQAQRAALAPARPSATDRSVASQASQMATAARAEIQSSRGVDSSEEEPNAAEEERVDSSFPSRASGSPAESESEEAIGSDSVDSDSGQNRADQLERTRAYRENASAAPVEQLLGAIFG